MLSVGWLMADAGARQRLLVVTDVERQMGRVKRQLEISIER